MRSYALALVLTFLSILDTASVSASVSHAPPKSPLGDLDATFADRLDEASGAPLHPIQVAELSDGCSYDLDSEYNLLWTDPAFGYDVPTLVEFGDHDFSELSDTRCPGSPAIRIDMRARVYYPLARGTFPLVLILHGQQSDYDLAGYLGYGWLAAPLARRGFVVASIDGRSLLDSTIKSRGEHLREHLRRFATMNAPGSGSLLEGRLDLSSVILIGHSRGGDAIAAAWEWQRVSPDPQYHIQTLLAIAPVQFFGTLEGEPDFISHLRDVDYLIFQGSKDGDVSDFQGMRQYDRTAHPSLPGLTTKAMVYLKDANHNSFNTVWASEVGDDYCCSDTLSPDLARQVAAVYLIAFIQQSLFEDPQAHDLLTGTLGNPVEGTTVALDFQEANETTIYLDPGELDSDYTPLESATGGSISTFPVDAETALTELWVHDWAPYPYGSYRGETMIEGVSWEGDLELSYSLSASVLDQLSLIDTPCVSLRFAEVADTAPETTEYSTAIDGVSLSLEDASGNRSTSAPLTLQLVPTQTWENLEAGPRTVMTQLRACTDAFQGSSLDTPAALHLWLSLRKTRTVMVDDLRFTR